MRLGLYLGWHVHPWEELLALVRHAEDLGYAAAIVDGDVSMLTRRTEDDCLDGWTVTSALLASTDHIEIGSLRLVHHWNAARLAQAASTAERITPGRLRFTISIGDWAVDARFGLPRLQAAERVAWLDETLEAVRALWRGETVTRRGRYVQLDGARVRPTPPGGRLPITIAGRRARMLEVVARHADFWDINLPPIRDQVAGAEEQLAAACERVGRDPAGIGRSMLLFTRVDLDPEDALGEFRRLNPWFGEIPDQELRPALLVGEPARVRQSVRERASELGLALPILDLSGVEAPRARRLLDALGPANNLVDAST
ncbi:MAG: LLM class flavin-dependent oxidoreductase [Myxococcota bacterium]|nr:LLM class flavin-dependent oxidoreductase [Myxococcota bacterium]